MDLLTRLIAGTSSPTKQRANTPAERLASCKSICNALTQTWRNGAVEREDEAALNHTTKLLRRLETILHDESRRAAPHSCLRYVASSQTYIIITKLSVSCRDVEIIKASAQLFHILINGETEGLLDSKLFTRSLLDLVCYATIGGKVIVEERLQTDLVELLFEIATKIRLDPDILPAWFYPDREPTRGRNPADETRRSQFPLFHVLVQYVHHDGPVGDFARTALLYLTETASRFKPLETWMIESDLAPQMASGLGALYSRLNRQSTPLNAQALALPIVLLSDRMNTLDSLAESPQDTQLATKAFFSYLAFWQDTLNHCKSAEVSDTLLDHFQVLFVQQLLYPSLLESSDVEGGSTAAVIGHLSQILLSIDHIQLVDSILCYLLASPNMPPEHKTKSHRRQRMSVSRRRSVDQLKALADVSDSPSPNLFNLLDLMVISLKSRHSETVDACLKLLSVIVNRHHSQVLTNLFRLEPGLGIQGLHGVHELNTCLFKFFDLAGGIAQNADMDSSYRAALLDGQVLLEQHSCFTSNDEEQLEMRGMSIARECKLFEALVSLLREFFANDTVTNLYLSEAIMALAACEHMNLHGWLLPSSQQSHTEDNSAYNISFAIGELVEQVRQWKSQFSEWDELISRRRMELFEEQPQKQQFPERTSSRLPIEINTGIRSDSPSSNPSMGSSRPTTPRGRKIATTEFGSIDSAMAKPGGHRASLAERTLVRSPLRRSVQPGEGDDFPAHSELPSRPPPPAVLKTQVVLSNLKAPEEASDSLPVLAGRKQTSSPGLDENLLAIGGSGDSGTVTPSGQDDLAARNQASLSHILTNAIILQEFILELAAVVQLRATFFSEVAFKA